MFMDNKALLDQLMGKDRNAPTFKGISEQWKDPAVCKHYLIDFCPYEVLHNTKVSVGNCRNSHSDVVKQQFDASSDADKPNLARKYEVDLLTHLERIVDTVDSRVRKQSERIRIHNQAVLRLPAEKQREIDEVNDQISISMRQVERLAEQGLLDESGILMVKVDELNKRATDLRTEAEKRYFRHETICETCGAITIYTATGDDKEELINDHLGGRQHLGMEKVRMKVIEIKTRRKLPLSRRDRDFRPSDKLQNELRREGIEVTIPGESKNDDNRRHGVLSPSRSGQRDGGDRGNRQHRSQGRRSRSRDRYKSTSRNRSPSTPRSMVSITFE